MTSTSHLPLSFSHFTWEMATEYMQLCLYLKMLFVLQNLYVQKIVLTSLKCKLPVGFF